MSRFIRFFVLSLAIACAVTLVNSQDNGEQKTKQDHHSFAAEVLPMSLAAPTHALVSSRKPDGMILSEGNLYFTSHDAAGAAVWRTAQSSVPGQEAILYWEAGATFGDIVFAKVDGVFFFGYFFATKGGAEITIKRVPLTGGTATVLATLKNVDIANSHRNLIADGVNLYWQDDSAVRKIPIRGGPVTVLDPSSPNTPTAGLALQNGNVIYASVADIRFVPPNGATTSPQLRTIATASSRVTALHAVSNGVYWGENNGAVRRRVEATTTTLQATGPIPTSISTSGSTAGGAQSWTQCAGQSCQLRFVLSLFKVTKTIGDDALGVTVTPSRTVFWGDAAGVHRQVF